ncbi:MAG: TrkH family potassium uptake protein [Nitrospirae bacterium]|nr:MAG: TrkH family potassium uptake protein [Nitrospirota bacterium]
MLHLPTILRILGFMSAFYGAAMALPWAYGRLAGEEAAGIGLAAACALGLGLILLVTMPRERREVSHREGFLIVTLTWLLAAGLGALPYLFTGTLHSVTDAFFEAMSGFTTTGSTVLSGLDRMPRSILLWRSLTQWLGGMGMILLSIAILPLLGVGGMQLFKAETPGPVTDKLRPRVRDTAARLWGIYATLTLAEVVCLKLAGVPLYDAVCHSLTTLPGGGFSTHDASIAYFHSAAVEAIVTVFMLAGGINFVLYYAAATGRWRTVLRDSELRFFALVFAGACALVVVNLRLTTYGGWAEAVRYGVFQVATCISTTGFATADYERWSHLPQVILITAMVTGAMAGSTSGALKEMRILVLLKRAGLQLRQLVHPHAVVRVHISGRAVDPEIVHGVWGFFFLYMLVLSIASMLLASLGLDYVTSVTAVITTMGNVGPGLGLVGPSETFAALPAAAKWVLSGCMLLGRLEIYTVLVLFLPEFWRR